jgi:hypothetical protein
MLRYKIYRRMLRLSDAREDIRYPISIAWDGIAADAGVEAQEFSSNPIINDKIKLATTGLDKNIPI